MALQSFFLKVAKIENVKNFSIKNLSLPLTSGVKFFFRPTTFEFWIICLHVIHALFLLLYSKGYGFFGDKQFKNQKWFVGKKIRHQKLGIMKSFFTLNFFSFLITATFWKNDCSATWKPNSFKKKFGSLSTQKCSKASKTCSASAVIYFYSLLHAWANSAQALWQINA